MRGSRKGKTAPQDLSLYSGHQKHRCGGKADLFICRPDTLPDLFVRLAAADQPFELLQIPGRPADIRKRNAARDVLHHIEVMSDIAVEDPLLRGMDPVLKDGHVMEYGKAKDVLEDPQNDYTKKLLSAVPRLRRA